MKIFSGLEAGLKTKWTNETSARGAVNSSACSWALPTPVGISGL
jgi:hypothetical protein